MNGSSDLAHFFLKILAIELAVISTQFPVKVPVFELLAEEDATLSFSADLVFELFELADMVPESDEISTRNSPEIGLHAT